MVLYIRLSTAVVNLGLPFEQNIVLRKDLTLVIIRMPINLRIYEMVVSKADLLIERDMPECLRELCAHVASYQTVLKKWENNDFSEHTSLIDYPGRELLDYSHRSFQRTERKTIEFSWRKNKGHLKLHF